MPALKSHILLLPSASQLGQRTPLHRLTLHAFRLSITPRPTGPLPRQRTVRCPSPQTCAAYCPQWRSVWRTPPAGPRCGCGWCPRTGATAALRAWGGRGRVEEEAGVSGSAQDGAARAANVVLAEAASKRLHAPLPFLVQMATDRTTCTGSKRGRVRVGMGRRRRKLRWRHRGSRTFTAAKGATPAVGASPTAQQPLRRQRGCAPSSAAPATGLCDPGSRRPRSHHNRSLCARVRSF
jgi:hypothetical protein